MAITQGSFDSIQASIALHKIVTKTADIFELCTSGDVAGIHAMIKMARHHRMTPIARVAPHC
jgi:hypothetical protein